MDKREIDFLLPGIEKIPDNIEFSPGSRDESCENQVETPTHYSRGYLEWGTAILYPHAQEGIYSLQSLSFYDWAWMTDSTITADTALVVLSLTNAYGRIQEILLVDSVYSDGFTGSLDLGGLQYEISDSTTYLKATLFPLTSAGDVNDDGEEDYAPFFLADNGQNPTGLSGWDSRADYGIISFTPSYINWSVDLCRNYVGDFTYCGMLENYSIYAEGEMIAQTTNTQYQYEIPMLDSTICYSLGAEYEQGMSGETAECLTFVVEAMGVNELSMVPGVFQLAQNYPNPFNPVTHIRFFLPERSPLKLSIFDILGREVNRVSHSDMDQGTHVITWNGTSFSGEKVSAGIYIYTLEAGRFNGTRKMIYLK